MLDPGERPLLFGFLTAALLAVLLRYIPGDLIGTNGARGIGLAVFGTAIVWLSYQTRDSASIFRFFLGGLLGILVVFFLALKF